MIDYQKHRENLTETLGRKNPTLTGRFQHLLSLDAEELLDKAEERDKLIGIIEYWREILGNRARDYGLSREAQEVMDDIEKLIGIDPVEEGKK